MKNHGLSLFIAWYKENGCDFFAFDERQFRRMSFISSKPKPKEITQAVCYRYLRMKNKLTVGDWNSILKIAVLRVSSGPGANVILRSLWIDERKKKKIYLNRYDFVGTFGKNPRSFSDIEKRLIRIKKATLIRKEKEFRQRAIDENKQYVMVRKAKEELKLLNQSISTFNEVLKNGKKHNEINPCIPCACS